MNKMLLAVWLAVLGTMSAGAQVLGTFTLLTNGVPAAITNSAFLTNTVTTALDTMKETTVGLLITATSQGVTNTTVSTFGFRWSLDGTTYYTDDRLRIPLTADTTNTASVYTNVDCSWFRYLKPSTMENIATTGTTNDTRSVVIKYFFK
jgi:hypothetical protein